MKHKARTKAMSWLLSLALMLGLMPGMGLTAQAALPDKVYYRVYDYSDSKLTYTDNEIASSDVIEVTNDTDPFWGYDYWYVVNQNVEITDQIEVNGTVNLILCDDAKLTASRGVEVSEGNTLNIYGQSNGTGKLIATGYQGNAAIGGEGNYGGGTVNIHGGTVTATCDDIGAGIGGGYGAGGGTVTIYGGTVNAIGGGNGNSVGIGGGSGNNNHGSLTLGAGVKLETSSNYSTWTDSTSNTSTRTKCMKTSYTPPHTHNFTYSADGDTITATCGEDGCDLPEVGDKHTATLTIKPPANLVYDNKAKAATVENNINSDELTITYKKGNDTVEAENVKETGDYTASVTLEGQTASVDFTIKDTSYTITIPATLTVANAGWNATAGITASGEIAEDKKLTVTATSANDWKLKSGTNEIGYHLATAEGGAATTVWDFSVDELAKQDGTSKTMGAVVEEYINAPEGDYTDTVTFTAKVEDAIKVVDLSTISEQYYYVTENVILTGTPNGDFFTIEYTNNNYEVTLDNVNSAGNKVVDVDGSDKNMNIKLKGTSKLRTLKTTGTLTIDEAESGGTVILVYDYDFLGGSTVTINGGTVKARSTDGSSAKGSLTVNGGAVYLAGAGSSYAVAGSITAGSGVTLYGWDGNEWTTANTNVQYVTTDNTSGDPTNWGW